MQVLCVAAVVCMQAGFVQSLTLVSWAVQQVRDTDRVLSSGEEREGSLESLTPCTCYGLKMFAGGG